MSNDAPSEWQRLYQADAEVLRRLGWVLAHAELARIEVRLPRPLAGAAIAAWEREGNEGPLKTETFEQRVQRHRAGTLGLIGLSIVNGGRWEADEMVVELSPDLIGIAIEASNDLPSI